MKVLSEDKAIELSEMLLQNDKNIKDELETKINEIKNNDNEENSNTSGYVTKEEFEEFSQDVYIYDDCTYYFSTNGNDDNDGKTPNTPKKTFKNFVKDGNKLFFKAGDVFLLDEVFYVNESNITISSYGEGKAMFSGLHTSSKSFKTTEKSNVYSIQFEKDVDPGYIIIEGDECKNWKRLTTVPNSYNENEWYFDRTNFVLYYYSSASVAGKSVQYSLGSKGIGVGNCENIIISNIEVCDFAYHGISIENNVSNIKVLNNIVHDIGGGIDTQVVRYGNAIQVWLSNSNDIYVENNRIHDVYDTGITPQGSKSDRDCYNIFIKNNNIRRCSYMMEFFNSTPTIACDIHFEDNFCYQVKDITGGYRTPTEYAYTHLSFILVWNSDSPYDKIYFKNNICIESDYCALAFSQNTIKNKLFFEENLFICDPLEKIHNSYVLDELPEVLSIRNSGLTDDEVNSLIDIALEDFSGVSDEQVKEAVSEYLDENPVQASNTEQLERIYFNVDGGLYWNKSGELIEYLTKVSATTFDQLISVKEGEKFRVTMGGIWVGTNPAQIVFFDSNKNFVGVPFTNANVTAKDFSIPTGASYMGVSVWSGIEPVLYRVSGLSSYSENRVREEHLARMQHEQNIQHTTKIPYYKTPTKPYITFVHDDCRSVFDVLAQHFIDRDIPLCVATPPSALTMSASNGDLSMKQILDKVVEAGGEVLSHHGKQMTQEMLEDYDTCFEHFVTTKKVLEDCGYDVNGIILAGGVGQVACSPISDMWVRSYYLYSDLYGEVEYDAPYCHPRQSLVNLNNFDGAKTRILEAIDNNEWLVLYLHDWADFAENDLTQLLDWINEQDITVNTYKQVYDELIAYKGIVEGNNDGSSTNITNYGDLQNLPSINGVTLKGNKTTSDLKIVAEVDDEIIQNAVTEYLTENPSATTDALAGKRILCIGDSICEGVGANNQPYPYWIKLWHPTTEVFNLGVGGMTVGQKDVSITNSMPVRIANNEFISDDYANIDIVVFEGGINDLMNNVKLGYISNGYNINKYKTFCQGMEYMFSHFKDLYPKARMIFMSTHNVSAHDYNKSKAWWGAASEICAKWGVEFLDLFSLMCTSKISGLQLHPSCNVHRDYYAKYLDMALVSNSPLSGARTTNYYMQNAPVMLAFYNGTKSFNVGSSISTSDWRINMVRADLTTYENVTSNVKYDMSDVDTTTVGTYPIHVAYSENGITLSIDVEITIIESGSTDKILDSIYGSKVVTSYTVGSQVDTNDITVTASYTDGTTKNVTNSATFDTSNINNTVTGEYNIAVSYTENDITKTTAIQINIVEEGNTATSTSGTAKDNNNDENVRWSIDSDGVITFDSTKSETIIATYDEAERPWNDYIAQITKAVFKSNIIGTGSSVLINATSLEEVDLQAESVAIGGNAFKGCTSLAEIDLTKANSIGMYGLSDCTSLPSEIILGETKLQNSSFYTQPNISTIRFSGTPSSIGTEAFTNITAWGKSENLKDIYVPWSEGAVANAPWGATSATIHYNTTI